MRLNTLHSIRLSNFSIRNMANVLLEERLDVHAAFRAAGIPHSVLDAADACITGEEEFAFQHQFASLTHGRHDLWIRTGLRYRMLAFGTFGLARLTAPTFRHLLQTSARFNQLHYSLCSFTPLQEDGRLTGCAFDLSEVPEDLREFTLFRDLGALVATWRDLGVQRIPCSEIRLSTAPPACDCSALLGNIPLVYGAEECSWRWPAGTEELVLPNGDPLMHEIYTRQCEQLLAGSAGEGFLDRLLSQMGEDRPASLKEVAMRMGMSARTLQRRLGPYGLSFQGLQNQVRAQAAKRMLGNPKLSISEIAWRLGYADVSAFSHAFQRWTGVSPRRFRHN
ncbi:helix-turn-helix transcriptional regulator [Pseudomonas schmalbachii]|uniref:Helix-turn-helix domain-containing protein n=1 Tax=Pseudomonas schmalbachii TaxID=2816993 RepID=A0ABS3TXH6_9PSED|nr:AraC family transcriptional regulator [Pseudomonas schmalbachii]MBO3277380.1 helix-turn-helix domain-containing protein [Pseudomonas schmalbachii]